ncbi:MAG: hypothetical protein ABR500_11490 [Dermatophilaceae bacterium]|nr:hypothetical protein [Intrasporangiaceae bacterium]
MISHTSDVKGIVRVLAHHDVEYLLSTTTAELLDDLAAEPGWQGPPTTVYPSPDPESLSRLSDALFSMSSRPSGAEETGEERPAWSPWPSEADNLVGTYETDLGRLVVAAPLDLDRGLDTAVVVDIAGYDVKISRRGAARLSPRTSRLLSEPL